MSTVRTILLNTARVHVTTGNINYFFACSSVLCKTDFSILSMWEDLNTPSLFQIESPFLKSNNNSLLTYLFTYYPCCITISPHWSFLSIHIWPHFSLKTPYRGNLLDQIDTRPPFVPINFIMLFFASFSFITYSMERY